MKKTGIGVLLYLTVLLFSCSEIKRIEKRADKGDASACYQAVQYYVDHIDYLRDEKKAEEKIIKYSAKGILITAVDSQRLAFYKSLVYYNTDRATKYAYYKKAALLNDTEAQWHTGLYYLEGQEKEIQNDSALYWLNKAAFGNNPKYAALANYELGNVYSIGKIVTKDTLAALEYYKKACAGNYAHQPSCNKVISYSQRIFNHNVESGLEVGNDERRYYDPAHNEMTILFDKKFIFCISIRKFPTDNPDKTDNYISWAAGIYKTIGDTLYLSFPPDSSQELKDLKNKYYFTNTTLDPIDLELATEPSQLAYSLLYQKCENCGQIVSVFEDAKAIIANDRIIFFPGNKKQ